eukprot:IDg13173t1
MPRVAHVLGTVEWKVPSFKRYKMEVFPAKNRKSKEESSPAQRREARFQVVSVTARLHKRSASRRNRAEDATRSRSVGATFRVRVRLYTNEVGPPCTAVLCAPVVSGVSGAARIGHVWTRVPFAVAPASCLLSTLPAAVELQYWRTSPRMGSDVVAGAAIDAPDAEANAALVARGKEARVRWVTSRRDFRARAHSNPLNDGAFVPPEGPLAFAASGVFTDGGAPEWADIGCGYGGLLAALSAAFPEKRMLGMEIRDRVAAYCGERVRSLRAAHPGEYGNIAFVRTNAMKLLPYYFARASLDKLFFCYPDPHFKRRKNRQRVISDALLAEYAYVLRPGGVAYIVTDVPELFAWMDTRLARHPLFRRRAENVQENDPITPFVRDMTDEAQRVEKSPRGKMCASFERVADPRVCDGQYTVFLSGCFAINQRLRSRTLKRLRASTNGKRVTGLVGLFLMKFCSCARVVRLSLDDELNRI